MKKFEQELETLHTRLAEMGSLAESMVARVTAAFSNYDRAVFETLRTDESRLDEFQLEIDHDAVRLLTVYGPVAADLRSILTVSHVNTFLERIGDQSINLCEDLELMTSHKVNDPHQELHRMAALVGQMVRDALNAFFNRDVDLAESTLSRDDVVDSMNDQIIRELLNADRLREVLKGPVDIKDALVQILIAKSLERIADLSTNICEEAIYRVRGDDVRHHSLDS